ncbi:MAG: hypothetical protein JW884_01895, partial [Deltaproteobacteria bacterium]|nr:hypothetical protein [Deltaproteobacteria bacterium]
RQVTSEPAVGRRERKGSAVRMKRCTFTATILIAGLSMCVFGFSRTLEASEVILLYTSDTEGYVEPCG